MVEGGVRGWERGERDREGCWKEGLEGVRGVVGRGVVEGGGAPASLLDPGITGIRCDSFRAIPIASIPMPTNRYADK